MLWLEMSRNEAHGGGDWGFGKCLWSPTRKNVGDGKPEARWPFWQAVASVRAGDLVLHLRGKGPKAAFVGYSTAAEDSSETTERPPDPGEWEYAKSFYRVPLRQYTELPTSIRLLDVLRTRDAELRAYFRANKGVADSARRRIFLVEQAGRLQCLNGAYLSEVDATLQALLLDELLVTSGDVSRDQAAVVATRERVATLRSRVGQQDFSLAVRENYRERCCFPGCKVSDGRFLIGAHIARWADHAAHRGKIANGLCLCLMHDKAFETGAFYLDDGLHVRVHRPRLRDPSDAWCDEHLVPHDGQPLLSASTSPDPVCVTLHRLRVQALPPIR